MYVTTSNELTEANIEVLTGSNPNYSDSDLVSSSFSEIYFFNTTQNYVSVELTINSPDYIALGGINVADRAQYILIQYYNGSAYVDERYYNNPKDTVLVHRVINSATKYKVVIYKPDASDVVSIANIAAGDLWELPFSQPAGGFADPLYAPALKSRTQQYKGMPTVTIKEQVSTDVTIDLQNILTTDIQSRWLDFQTFAIKNNVYVLRDTDDAQNAFYLYDVTPMKPVRSSKTSALYSASISGTAYTGLV